MIKGRTETEGDVLGAGSEAVNKGKELELARSAGREA
jgi:hypothetical protein